MLDLDPNNLGTFTASAHNAKRYRILLVPEAAGVTPQILEAQPDWNSDQVLGAKEATDSGGKAEFDLGPLQKDIKSKLRTLKLPHGAPLSSFVVGIPETGAPKAVAGPAFKLNWDVIPVGSAICPPRPTNEDQEKAWFAKLEEVTLDDLQPGDVLIRKNYEGTSPVVLAQVPFQAASGSKFSCHAMLYLGGGKVIHAYEVPMAVGTSDPPKGATIIAWRATEKQHADSAVAVARWLDGAKLKYSMAHCAGAAPHSSAWGPVAEGRARDIAARRAPTARSMCSEFVSYCYQGIAGNPWIRLDAMRVAPIRLEDYLNANPDRFRFAGRIMMPGKEDGSTADLVKKAFENIGDEIKEAAGDAGKKIEAVANKVGAAVAPAAQKVAAAVAPVANKVADGAKNLLKKLF